MKIFNNPLQDAASLMNDYDFWQLKKYGSVTSANLDEIESDPFSRLTSAEEAFLFTKENPE